MAIPAFLQDKDSKKKKNKQKAKGDFREKCLKLLEQIKGLNEEKYHQLSKTFKDKYDKANIQKKIILGFYAQLVSEVKKLTDSAQDKFMTSSVVIKKYEAPVKEAVQKVKKATEKIKKNGAQKTAKKVAKTVKKAAKKATKNAKKAAKKVTKTAKKAAKKVSKTAKKAATKKKPTAKKKKKKKS
ncbi:MAG: hypothetical protein HN509_14215 [Halobacteriovoraceae bacterium]|nr:hypothetical protein [Halobacteriovoraceae bacterium]